MFVRAKKSSVMPCVTFIAFLLGGLRLYRVLNQKKRKKLKFFNLQLNLLGLKKNLLELNQPKLLAPRGIKPLHKKD